MRMHEERIPCDSCSFFPYKRNRTRNLKNAEHAKQPLLLLTSVILNHNCPALLVRCIHRRKALVSPPSLWSPFFSSSFIPFAVLSSFLAIALLLLLSGIPSPSLSLTRAFDASPLLVGSKRSSAAAATVAIVVLVGAKLPQFYTFYTAREKKRIIFGGNATILSAVVM